MVGFRQPYLLGPGTSEGKEKHWWKLGFGPKLRYVHTEESQSFLPWKLGPLEGSGSNKKIGDAGNTFLVQETVKVRKEKALDWTC